jgi:hypothetical protein
MAAETSRPEMKFFSRIRIVMTDGQRRSHLVLAPAAQMAALSGLLCGALLLSYLGMGQIRDPRLVARADSAAARAEIANVDLQDSVARLEDRLARMASERSAAENRLATLKERAASASDRLAAAAARLAVAGALQAPPPAPAAPPAASPNNLAQLTAALTHVRLAVHDLTIENATLAARLNNTEADRAEESALYQHYKEGLAHARRAARRRGGRCCVKPAYGGRGDRTSATPEVKVREGRAAGVRF